MAIAKTRLPRIAAETPFVICPQVSFGASSTVRVEPCERSAT
ncbi:hypothetical protein ABLO27_12825 [Roseibium sp. SCPC15]